MEGACRRSSCRAYLGVRLGLGQAVVDLGRVGNRLQAPPHSCQGAGDEVGSAAVPHPEHHAGAHVEDVALPLVPPCAAARDDVPAGACQPLEFDRDPLSSNPQVCCEAAAQTSQPETS